MVITRKQHTFTPFTPPKGGRGVFLFFLLFFALCAPIDAQKSKQKPKQKAKVSAPKVQPQKSKQVKDLEQQQSKLKKELTDNQKKLDNTRQQVVTGEQNVTFLGVQIDNRLTRIRQLEEELDKLEADITRHQKDITKLDGEVRQCRQHLKAAVRNARAHRENRDPFVFVLSAKTFSQMYRRARYAREYVSYQQNLGEQLLQKQAELLKAQSLLLEAKNKQNKLLNELMLQRRDLNIQQIQERKKVAGLRKQESGLQDKVKQQQKQLADLDKKIEEIIAKEIEEARKKAEAEARKKAEAEARKKAEAEASKKVSSSKKGTSSKKGKQGTSSKKQPASGKQQPSGDSKPKQSTTPTKQGNWLSAEDRSLSGSFEQNRGRLLVPITGQYVIGKRFGRYNVSKYVQLDNKGTHYVGRAEARARAVFDGVVTAVFQFGGRRNVLIRHGSYISVYCNLSSTIVTKGQKVKGGDILGTVAKDDNGNYTLQFQLHKEKITLNPEGWIGK